MTILKLAANEPQINRFSNPAQPMTATQGGSQAAKVTTPIGASKHQHTQSLKK